MPHAPQDTPDGQPELARKVVGLVETALERAERMERNGNHGVRARQKIGTFVPQKRRKRPGEPAPALVLERVND